MDIHNFSNSFLNRSSDFSDSLSTAEMQACREERLSSQCRSWSDTSFTVSASSAFQPVAAEELGYDDVALCKKFCHMGRVHGASSGSMGDCWLSP